MTRSRQTADWGSRAGLAKIVPSSVAVGSGTGSADSLGTVTFSSASSVSLNGVFNSTYDNYKIIFNSDPIATTAQAALLRLRTSSDDSGANYNQSGFYNSSNTASPLQPDADTNQTSWRSMYLTTTAGDYHMAIIEIIVPNLAKPTGYQMLSSQRVGATSQCVLRSGALNTTTQYTGFTLSATTAMTGTIRVYGYTQ